MRLDPSTLRGAFGLGVAGNFAGHLEQAGEARDFTAVQAPAEAPKGIFPFYVPGDPGFLGTFPLSHDTLAVPAGGGDVQLEPEVALLCDVTYDADGVRDLAVRAFGAFDDCSIRREGAPKISHKKNWGAASKGVAATFVAVDDLEAQTATWRLGCWLRRDGATEAYGVDSPLPGYSYYGRALLAWLVDRLRHQEGADGTPLEPVGRLLLGAGRPATALVAIGATRYTPLGASTYVQDGDEALVVVYDAAVTSAQEVAAAVAAAEEDALPAASVLRRRVA